MQGFLGEVESTLDDKGRILLPAKFLKQMPAENSDAFVINRGIEKCLVLYTLPEWQNTVQGMEHLNEFSVENRLFLRQFFRGATELNLDSQKRLLIPRRLCAYAAIQKEVILLGYFNKIEIWDSAEYEKTMQIQPEDYSDLANKVMNFKNL